MQVSIELSLYPLAQEQYKDEIWAFIESLRADKQVNVVTNGMSTQVFGEYDHTVALVMNQIKQVHQAVNNAVFIVKLIASDRSRTY